MFYYATHKFYYIRIEIYIKYLQKYRGCAIYRAMKADRERK